MSDMLDDILSSRIWSGPLTENERELALSTFRRWRGARRWGNFILKIYDAETAMLRQALVDLNGPDWEYKLQERDKIVEGLQRIEEERKQQEHGSSSWGQVSGFTTEEDKS